MVSVVPNRLQKLESQIHMMVKLQEEVQKMKSAKSGSFKPATKSSQSSETKLSKPDTRGSTATKGSQRKSRGSTSMESTPDIFKKHIEQPSANKQSLGDLIKSFFDSLPDHQKQATLDKGKEAEQKKDRMVSCELISKLREEIRNNREQLEEIEKNKRLAIQVSDKLRQKYEEMRESKQKTEEELRQLRKEKEEFKRKIEEDLKNRVNEIENEKNKMILKLRSEMEQKTSQLIKNTNKNLGVKSAKLSQTVEESKAQLINAQRASEMLQKQIETYKVEYEKSRKENLLLKNKLKQKKAKELENCEKLDEMKRKLDDSTTKEHMARKEINSLNDQVKALRDTSLYRSKIEIDNMRFEYRMLQNKCELIQKTLQDTDREDRVKFVAIETELRKFTRIMSEKEKILIKEKNELKKLVDDLTVLVQQHKDKINELLLVNTQQQVMIESQKEAISDKEGEIEKLKDEKDSLLGKNKDLEEKVVQLDAMSKTVLDLRVQLEAKATENNIVVERVVILETELQEMKKDLLSKKEQISVKDRIIDEQANTIKTLKNFKGEVKTAEQETQTKQTTSTTPFNATDAAVKDGQMLLQSLQAQIEMKEQVWATEKSKLVREKEQALKATRFATQKLLDTVADFQKQVEGQKKVQQLLASLLREKENQLKIATKHMGELGMNFSQPKIEGVPDMSACSCNDMPCVCPLSPDGSYCS